MENNFPEYVAIPEYDKIINSLPKIKLFKQDIRGLESVKINQSEFESIHIDSLTAEAKTFIMNAIKKYKYINFSRYKYNCMVLYMIGIPDHFVSKNIFFMNDLVHCHFKCFDIKKHPLTGDSGYWIIYI